MWPPRSPDLTPLDFNVWGYVKDSVYVFCLLRILRELRENIRDAVMVCYVEHEEGLRSNGLTERLSTKA